MIIYNYIIHNIIIYNIIIYNDDDNAESGRNIIRHELSFTKTCK